MGKASIGFYNGVQNVMNIDSMIRSVAGRWYDYVGQGVLFGLNMFVSASGVSGAWSGISNLVDELNYKKMQSIAKDVSVRDIDGGPELTELLEDIVVNGEYSAFGEMSRADGIRYRNWNFEKIREMSIHNPNSNSMTLGKYFDGTIESGSYVAMAELTGDTYFSLGTKWDNIKDAYGLTDKDMFELFNTTALDNAVLNDKTIRFVQDPRKWYNTALGDEWNYLQRKHGYTDLKEKGGYWYAIK